jgi:hypothetical protein
MAARYRSGSSLTAAGSALSPGSFGDRGTPSPGLIPNPMLGPPLYRRIERSAVLQGFNQATVPARLRMLLNEGKPAHENERRYDKSGYDPLHHGCHSMRLATAGRC